MKNTITIMRPGCADEVVEIEISTTPGYDELSRILSPIFGEADWEHVYVLGPGDKPADLFVDENGHYKRLQRNEPATAIYRRNTLRSHPQTPAESLPCIVGPAVLFSRRVWS